MMNRIMLFSVVSIFFLGINSNANAFHYDEREAIASAAHIVDEKAQHLHEWAERRAHHPSRREERSLRDLHQFAEEANHFHSVVENWRGNRHLRNDFNKLLQAWYDAEETFHLLHAEGHVYQDYLAARDAMYRLQAMADSSQTLNPHRQRGQRDWWENMMEGFFRH